MQRKSQRGDPIREAAISALKHVADPLLELMFDAGLTVQEFNYLVRDRAVRTATNRVIKECGRNSKSRVAIMTGLPRSEVTKILELKDSASRTPLGQHPARRVLAAWYDNPRFLTPTASLLYFRYLARDAASNSLFQPMGEESRCVQCLMSLPK